MAKITRMGRKPLGKQKYHFTCPPDLMARFDAIAAGLGQTRSDLIVGMIRERVEAQASVPAGRRPSPARGRVSK